MNYKIYIINLKKRPDRKEYMNNLFLSNGLKDFNFYEAIDGKNIPFTFEIKNMFFGNDFSYRKCFIGCALSHFNLWFQLSQDNENDFYVIFEDDITLHPKFYSHFQYIVSNIHIDNDITFLGFTDDKNSINYYDNEFISFIPFNTNLYNIGGLFSYIITKKGAQKCIELIIKNNLKNGIDYFIKINNNILNMSLIQPSITYTDWVKTKDDNIDSNIQKDYEIFNYNSIFDYHNYIYFSGLDQFDNDYCAIKQNIDDLFKYSNDNIFIDGFNTLCFMKNKIDINNLQKSPYFKSTDGSYVKLNKTYKIFFNSSSINNCLFNNIFITNTNEKNNNINYELIQNNDIETKIENNNIFLNHKTDFFIYTWNISYSYEEICNKILEKNNDNNILYITPDNINEIVKYKYCIITDSKYIIDAILTETFFFYLNENIPPLFNYISNSIYVHINNIKNIWLIYEYIKQNTWENRHLDILTEKYNILEYHFIAPFVERLLTKHLWKDKLINIINTSIIYVTNYNNNNIFIKLLQFFNFNIHFLDDNNLLYIYQHIFENNLEKYNNFIILDSTLTLKTSINNFLNHIEYLPINYDICLLDDFYNNFIVTNQINSLYYSIRKYNFNSTNTHIVSKNAILKIINNPSKYSSIGQIYNNIQNINLYSAKKNFLFSYD